jgi:hypothetical protein
MSKATYKVHGAMFLILATGAWLLGMTVVMSRFLPWGSLNPALLLYAGLLAVAVVELRVCVCRDCRNIFCVLKKNPESPRPSLDE